MKPLFFTAMLATAIGIAPPWAGAGALELAPNVTDEINVTTDSSPGWMPTADQRQGALAAVQSFLDAVQHGRYADAYGMQNPAVVHAQTLLQFTQYEQDFRALSGPLKFWRVTKVTWTKDPVQAPFPGVYAAVDLVSQFANVDRDCGFIVVYQPPAGRVFSILRRENNYLDNASARTVEQNQGKAEVAKVWGQLSSYCPNYVVSPDQP
ncbi:hypothetical protein FRZ44_12180 [Hypericibacter terrae]|uniref:DUF4019 domain-containing protein n=1 Tax=Hypericibacter terrae TaxID=2602015 RepID=A0A5J6MEN8_9PROT|nr:DUF4019 domain-containing protein [Hypericibacter terrae]QEX15928.1 hypothetical protein FRZ44_12180 [Hypericibacter terrae]